jgi:hypothetical protein
VTIDSSLLILGIALEVLTTAIVFRSRVHRILPIFAAYMVWGLMSDCWGLLTLQHSGSAQSSLYLRMFLIEMPMDAFIQFVVLVELAWAALRPFKALQPVRSVVGLSILTVAFGFILWPLAGLLPIAQFPPIYRSLYHLGYTVSILRVAIFLLLAAASQILSINWRNRELQVATGLGFYSLVSLGATLIHSHQTSAAAYHIVDVLTSVGYLVSLSYWATVFLKSEAPRQEFSPQMQRVLLRVAQASRVALESART